MDPSTLDGRSMGEPTLKEKAWEPSFEEGVLAMWKAEADLHRLAPVRGLRSRVLHGLRRIPRIQPSDLPRAVAQGPLLPRRTSDLLVPGMRNHPRRGGHRVRGPGFEPRLDEVPPFLGRRDQDRDNPA